ncbi:hypothetical protein BDR04DRAFT_1158051 [Suillus decipiens]|nr:hypothetical protein BDR04DRAFT_1158051 [Suillus decipiens]
MSTSSLTSHNMTPLSDYHVSLTPQTLLLPNSAAGLKKKAKSNISQQVDLVWDEIKSLQSSTISLYENKHQCFLAKLKTKSEAQCDMKKYDWLCATHEHEFNQPILSHKRQQEDRDSEIHLHKANNAKAHWQDIEVNVLLHYLIENWAVGGDGRNFTVSTFNAAAAAINTDTVIQTIGPQKTGKMVKTKWTSLKKIFNQIEIYCNISGFHWDNEWGAGIEGTTAASVWDTCVDPKSHITICPFCNKGWPPYDNMQMILGDNSSAHGRSSFATTDDVLDSIDGGLGLLEMDVDIVSAGVAYSNNVPDMSPDLMILPSALLHGSSPTTHVASGSQSSKCLHTNTLLNLTETSSQKTNATPMSSNSDTLPPSLPLSSTLVSSQLLAPKLSQLPAPKKAWMSAHGGTQAGINNAAKLTAKITPAAAVMNMQGSINCLTDAIEKNMVVPPELPVPTVPTIISHGLGIMCSQDDHLMAAQRASVLCIFSLAGGDNKLAIYVGLEDDVETHHAFISELLESSSQ